MELQPFITSIVTALLGVLTTVIIAALTSLRLKVNKWIESKTNNEQKALIDKWAKDAFSFAETMFKDLDGHEKLSHALTYLSDQLARKGIQLSDEEIRAAIEKAVLEYNLNKK